MGKIGSVCDVQHTASHESGVPHDFRRCFAACKLRASWPATDTACTKKHQLVTRLRSLKNDHGRVAE